MDARGESSNRILLQAETRKASRTGGGSSGGSGSSGSNTPPPTPTPIPLPILAISDGQTVEGETSFHEIVLDVARGGVAGFDIVFVIDDPTVAQIVGVTFAPAFNVIEGRSKFPTVYEVHLSVVDVAQLVTDEMIDVVFAVVELRAEPLPEGVSSQQTLLRLSNGLLGIQDDFNSVPIDVEMQFGVLVVN